MNIKCFFGLHQWCKESVIYDGKLHKYCLRNGCKKLYRYNGLDSDVLFEIIKSAHEWEKPLPKGVKWTCPKCSHDNYGIEGQTVTCMCGKEVDLGIRPTTPRPD